MDTSLTRNEEHRRAIAVARDLAGQLCEVRHHCRQEIEELTDERAMAILETTAEVLSGLEQALTDFQAEQEKPWRRGAEHLDSESPETCFE